MAEKNFPVIVIGRQFGSGARQVGKRVAEMLGFPYFDKELLAVSARKMGYAEEIFNLHDEKRPSPLHALLQGAYGIPDNFREVPLGGKGVHAIQNKVIRELCNRHPMVIVGRSADLTLSENNQLTSVFLHAPIEFRAQRIVARGDAATPAEAEELARKRDRERERYYNFYAGAPLWGKAENYDLSIDTSNFTTEQVATIIADIVRLKNN